MKNRNLDINDNWGTPPAFLEKLNRKFAFNFDPCPLNHNIILWDGLKVDWGERNFINPPYSRELKDAFVTKAVYESQKEKLCILLLPVSTSTVLFHKVIQPNARFIEYLERRLSFYGINQKGQFVNYHLIQDINPKETIEYKIWNEKKEEFEIKEIPKYVKNSGQHDSMIVMLK